jgi:adenylate cyclase
LANYDPAAVVRFIRFWYTYRTFVAILLAVAISGVCYWLFVQETYADSHPAQLVPGNVSVHPEDRLMAATDTSTNPNIEIVGIDDKTVNDIGQWPLPRSSYAAALQSLEQAGAAVVAFDVGFHDRSDNPDDNAFHTALAKATIPVILAYGGADTQPGSGQYVQNGVDQLPLKAFLCQDSNSVDSPNSPCAQPDKNVFLGSTDIANDSDGVLRRMPMFVEPRCYVTQTCSIQTLNPLGFAAYREYVLQGGDGPQLTEANGAASFGTAWPQAMPVDDTGAAIINYTGGPGNFKANGQYLSLGDVINGNVPPGSLKGKIVLIGAYGLTGVNDSDVVTTSAGEGGLPMAGVEIHANVLNMLLGVPPRFLQREPDIVVLLILLLFSLLMALAISRLPVIWGFVATVGALVAFTVAVAFVAGNGNLVPDLFHPWLGVGLVYAGVTAYRFLYEDRERRKVTSLFGQYLKPEIVAQLARQRGGVKDIMRGGSRRDITLLFVDVRGFTSMSEKMAAEDVTTVIQMYLDHLSGIIFTWDGTIDKYVGDEIVAFWNAPRDQPDHALLAIRCAYDMIAKAPELQHRLIEKNLPPIRWGIGVNTGPAVVGNMGSQSRLQYTALGDTVNTAARFCANAPAFHLLIGQPTYDAVKDYVAVDLVPGVQLKGKSAETFRIYQVTAIRENPSSPWVQFPTEMASEAHAQLTQQYTQKTILAAGKLDSREILVGTEAEQAMAAGPDGPPPEE